ncbi:hypothetical protein [Bradyrhizobium japonicum]|uniref:hypothetical protein n=1 Tax=Bradyrhizobium japonicum TaxID=375 RepID=UPI0004B4E3FC|nr:hypothetical protein [Bradyrhizobium japonicum]
MARKRPGQDEQVFSIMRPTLENLLELGVKFRLHKYILDQKELDWRSLESELGWKSPVKGIGLIATREEFEIHDNEDVSADEIVPFANQIPLDAAMGSYAFTMLESSGDEVVAAVNPLFSKDRSAWHRLIPDDVDRIEDDPLKASERFAEPFGLPPHRGYAKAVLKMAALKQARNNFAHRGAEVYFDDFFKDILYVATQVYFANLHDEKQLKLFPFSIMDSKWY